MPIYKNVAKQLSVSVRLSGSTDGPYVVSTWPNDATAKMYYSKDGATPVAVTPTRIDATLGGWLLSVATLTSSVWSCDELRIFWEGTGILSGGQVYYPEADYTSTVAGRIDAAMSTRSSHSAADVWAVGSRTLTGFGTLVADIATAVWGAAVRTLTAISDSAGVTTLLGRLSSTRAGYLDNLNTSGIVASQADITALNQGASRRITLACVPTMERPETGANTFTVELRVYDPDGAVVNATGTPTITPIGIVSGSLAANLGAVSNPATGVYRAIYTVAAAHVTQELRFDGSAVLADGTFTISALSQVADFVAANFSTADRTTLADILALADALPLLSEIRADIERGGGMLDLTKLAAVAAQARAELALPAQAPGTTSGLPIKSNLPVAPDNAGIAAGAASAATAATQSTTAATQATNAAADALAAKNRVLAGIPNATPGTNPGLPLKSDLPAAAPTVGAIADAVWDEVLSGHSATGSAGAALDASGGGGASAVLLVHGPFEFTVEGAGPDQVLEVRRGDILTVRAALKSLGGQPINLQGATLAAAIVGLDESDLVTGLTVTALQADEGTLEVVLDTTDSALANVRRARLIITRTVGANDITSYPAQLLFQ